MLNVKFNTCHPARASPGRKEPHEEADRFLPILRERAKISIFSERPRDKTVLDQVAFSRDRGFPSLSVCGVCVGVATRTACGALSLPWFSPSQGSGAVGTVEYGMVHARCYNCILV